MTRGADERVASRVGVGRFRGSDHYQGTDGNDLDVGDGADTTIVLVAQLFVRDPAGSQIVAHHFESGGEGFEDRGWLLGVDNSDNFVAEVGDGVTAGGFPVTLTSPEPGSLVWILSHDEGNTTMRARLNGVTGSVVAAINKSTNAFEIGAFGSGSAAQDFAAIGLLASSQALSANAMATLEAELIDNCEQGRDLDFNLSAFVPEVVYDARDLLVSGATPVASWSDRKNNGVDLSKNGSPELLDLPARF